MLSQFNCETETKWLLSQLNAPLFRAHDDDPAMYEVYYILYLGDTHAQ